MENEIKVGDWIRTNWGHIGKLKRIELDKNDKSLKWYVFDQFEINIIKEEYINKPYIVKHSPNLIDIIEEGDYINGYPVRRILNFNNKLCNFDLNNMEWIPLEEIDVWYEVVTKEMMESISYKVTKM